MAQNLDDVKQLVREGKLVPVGAVRDATSGEAEHAADPQPGDILPDPFIVVSVERGTLAGWHLKIRPLAPPKD